MIEIIVISMLCHPADAGCLPHQTVERVEPIERCDHMANHLNSNVARPHLPAKPVLYAWCARVGIDELK